jgi:hypothetical protein
MENSLQRSRMGSWRVVGLSLEHFIYITNSTLLAFVQYSVKAMDILNYRVQPEPQLGFESIPLEYERIIFL